MEKEVGFRVEGLGFRFGGLGFKFGGARFRAPVRTFTVIDASCSAWRDSTVNRVYGDFMGKNVSACAEKVPTERLYSLGS